MRGLLGIIALALSALLVGGCATRSDVVPGNKDYPYENTDRPIIPSEKTNRPIMALEFGAGEYAAVSSGHRSISDFSGGRPRSRIGGSVGIRGS